VLACVFETIKLFQYHNLKTSLLVCDGRSANAAVIKGPLDDRLKVQPWITNPFNPPNKINWIICPFH